MNAVNSAALYNTVLSTGDQPDQVAHQAQPAPIITTKPKTLPISILTDMFNPNNPVYCNPATVQDIYYIGKTMMNRPNRTLGKLHRGSPEDIRFCKKFGAGANVVLDAWGCILQFDLVSHGGLFVHLLWALMIMKTYGKEKGLCGSAGRESGAVDPKLFWKWTWLFIQALGLLEFEVVSFIVLSLLKISCTN